MGRAKLKVYEYTDNGEYIKTWGSINDFRKHHYSTDIGKRPIFVNKVLDFDFHITPIETIALTERPYRDKIKFLYKVYKSELCNFNKSKASEKKIQMFNLKNEVIAEFKNAIIAEKLLKDIYSLGTINAQLKSKKQEGVKGLVGDFYFKYKSTE